MPGESFTFDCGCDNLPGTTPPATTRYVVSLNDLVGMVTLAGTGSTEITSSGNTITIGLTAAAGLGSVTSVAATSSNTNLVIGGSPITTNGTITFALAGALNSISGLVTAADKMIYTTALDTYAVTDLTAFARTILDDANAGAVQTTLGLVIGTNVQAFSQDLSDFVTFVTWSGDDMTSTGGLTLGDALNVSGDITTTGAFSAGNGATISGTCTAGFFVGDGSGLSNLQAGDIASGTLAVARGGTGLSSYTVGDVVYASGTTTLAGLTAGAAGAFLRFAGAGVAPVVSTLILPNAATVGDLFSSSTTNTMSRITAVATGNVLLSGGVATLPAWGQVTSSHVNSTIATLTAGVNSDITSMTALGAVSSAVNFGNDITVSGALLDNGTDPGAANSILTSTGTGVQWSAQITQDVVTINTMLAIEGTITTGGTTGAQTINKPSGTVNFAAAATSLVVTNSLCTTSHRVQATVVTNDTTMKSVATVTTTGSFTIFPNAAPTAETAVYWELRLIS